MSNTERVRTFFEQMGTSTAAAAARALGLRGTQASCAVRELLERGWLTRVEGCHGIYEFHRLKEHEHGRAVQIQEKIWRAIRIAKSFTSWDIALYAGANLDYVREYMRFIQGQGLIKADGKRGPKTLYRCAAEPPTDTPVMRSVSNRRAVWHENLENLGWQMMRSLMGGDYRTAGELLDRFQEMLREKTQ